MSKRSERIPILREVLWRPWVVIVLALYGLLQLVSNIIAWLLPAEEQPKYQFLKLATWKVWLIGTPILTLALIVLIIRSALKVIAERDAGHVSTIQGLQRKYIRRRRRINRKFMAERATLGHYARELGDANVEKGNLEEKAYGLQQEIDQLKNEKGVLEGQVKDLEEQLSPKLEILFGQEHPPEYPFIERTGESTIYRIGIENTGGSTLYGVVVKMDGFSIGYVVPNNVPVPYNDLPLRARHEPHPWALSMTPR
jgi:hypothetical protein